jgi:hypothetical protein
MSEKIKTSESYQPADMVCVNISGFCPTMQWHSSHYSISEVEACIQQILLPHWLVVKTMMDGGGDLKLKLWKWSYQSTGRAALGVEPQPGNNQSCWMLGSADGSWRITHRHIFDTFIYKTRCDNSLKELVSSISSKRPMFNPSPLHKQFVVDTVALGQVFLQVLQFSICAPCSFIHAITEATWSQ